MSSLTHRLDASERRRRPRLPRRGRSRCRLPRRRPGRRRRRWRGRCPRYTAAAADPPKVHFPSLRQTGGADQGPKMGSMTDLREQPSNRREGRKKPPVRSCLHDVTYHATSSSLEAYTFFFLPSCSGGCFLNFPPKLGDMMGDISLFLEAVTEPIFPLSPRYLILIKLPCPCQ